MSLTAGIFLAFIAILYGSPLAALILGAGFTLIFRPSEELIQKSTGTLFLQAGIILIGLTMSASNAVQLTATYFPYISIYVVSTFFVGVLIGKIFKILKCLNFLFLILLKVSTDGIEVIKCMGIFSKEALEIAISLA